MITCRLDLVFAILGTPLLGVVAVILNHSGSSLHAYCEAEGLLGGG